MKGAKTDVLLRLVEAVSIRFRVTSPASIEEENRLAGENPSPYRGLRLVFP
jgi:hypothetical protein